MGVRCSLYNGRLEYPHTSRNVVYSKKLLAHDGTPLMALYEHITPIAPPLMTLTANGILYVDAQSHGPIMALSVACGMVPLGPQVPSKVLASKCFTVATP